MKKQNNANNLTLVLIIGIFIVVACSCPKDNSQNPSTPLNQQDNKNTSNGISNKSTETKTNENAGVTLANFNKLKTGMKYSEAVEILGSEGEVLSETDALGYKVVMYHWNSAEFTMTAMFQDGKLLSKAQSGLK